VYVLRTILFSATLLCSCHFTKTFRCSVSPHYVIILFLSFFLSFLPSPLFFAFFCSFISLLIYTSPPLEVPLCSVSKSFRSTIRNCLKDSLLSALPSSPPTVRHAFRFFFVLKTRCYCFNTNLKISPLIFYYPLLFKCQPRLPKPKYCIFLLKYNVEKCS
jgi:hypothetical protein